MSTPSSLDTDGYAGLRRAEPTLAARDYHDPSVFDAEMRSIWWHGWVHVCHASDIVGPRAFRLERIGTQDILLLRDEDGVLRAFHNTCRHRGSALCSGDEGRLKGRLIVCPYHAWSYSLRGDLVRVPSKRMPDGFARADHGLYRVAVEEWRGLVFVNLAEAPQESVAETLDPASADLANWPLQDLVVRHRLTRIMRCNWKIFWENFNECLHCPGVHPQLSALVPIYGRGLMARHDDPDWARHDGDPAPEHAGGLRAGAETWSMDGRTHGPTFQGLTEAERAAGQSYAMHLPSMFVVGHVDYMRTVRLMPLGPEETLLTANWLFDRQALADGLVDVANIVDFGRLVLEQDAEICEVNQRGLRSIRHRRGVLMPEEYELLRFHDWVRARREPTSL